MAAPVLTDLPVVTDDALAALARDVVAIGTDAGLAAVGIAGAEPFDDTRADLEARRAAGLAAGMQFTYRNPERSTDPDRILSGARSLVVGARGYLRRESADGPSGGDGTRGPLGSVARYARHDHYRDLRAALERVAARLVADGWRARVVADDNSLVDRAAAQRAGLGWYGRNSLLLTPGLGSWTVLGTVVTDAPLAATPPRGPTDPAAGCGTCRRCVAACPTGALVADGVLDAGRCLAWLAQAPGTFPDAHRAALGARIYGCDDCQQVCPVNRTVERRGRPGPPEADTVATVDLLALLAGTDAEVLAAHGRWYIADRDPRFLRRNALVALGNVADGTDPAVAAALVHHAGGDDELLAEHARWAAGRLGVPVPDAASHGDGPVTHLLVTNDFPPKVGGIQAYLWELWRRLDPDSYAVLTASSDPGAAEFDAAQAARGVRIERVPSRVLLPTPDLVRRIRAAAERVGAGLVVIDPAFPLGVLGPRLGLPYAVLLHGAEVAVPGRLPASREVLAHVVRGADLVVSAGGYPAAEARRAVRGRGMPPVVEIPPGVDLERFVPLDGAARRSARSDLGLPTEGPLVVSVSRLVPRKGMDVLIDAAAALSGRFPDLTVAIAGRGRDAERLAGRVAELGAPVRLLGGVSDGDLPRLVGAADVFAMLCRNRWLGLEQEGFGIVFLEAAAAGVAQVAGASGGAGEAVEDGVTGVVVRRPTEAGDVARAIAGLLEDPAAREAMGRAARRRAEASFDYDLLAPRLGASLGDVNG